MIFFIRIDGYKQNLKSKLISQWLYKRHIINWAPWFTFMCTQWKKKKFQVVIHLFTWTRSLNQVEEYTMKLLPIIATQIIFLQLSSNHSAPEKRPHKQCIIILEFL